MDAPGPFFFLIVDGLVSIELLAPLLERLPPEQYVRTALRGGEAFDSRRWPVARDAALAGVLARRFDEPEIARALVEAEAAAGDAERLRRLMRRAAARLAAASGTEPSLFTQQWSDATADDLAVFSEPPWSWRVAALVTNLIAAYHAAADGLHAHHVESRRPGVSAEAVANLFCQALLEGRIEVAELIDAAMRSAGAGGPESR
jgi:hypothetical protein